MWIAGSGEVIPTVIRDRARVVIVGGGIAGASIALHLARLGWKDVLVLEAGKLASGTTSHAPGLVGQLRSSVSLTKMLMYSVSLYRELTVDGFTGFQQVGSLRLASSPARLQELKRQEGFARSVALEAYLLTPAEIAQIFPLANLAGIEAALYLPQDGSATATVLAQAMILEATALGVSFEPDTTVRSVEVEAGRVRSVDTAAGRVQTDTLVIAAGIWSPLVARLAGASLPLTPMQHQYAATPAMKELHGYSVPNLRDPDNLVYVRQQGDSLVLGGYERDPVPCSLSRFPDRMDATLLPFDQRRFDPLRRAVEERVPFVAGYGLIRQVNGLESFTPDGEFLLGPSPEVRGLWAACGFCAHGISGAGGVGKVMAEWIAGGEPSLDLWHMDLRRIGGYAGARRYSEDRAVEICSTYYDIVYPAHEHASARDLRRSAVHVQLQREEAVFGEKAGWERPNWFASNKLAASHLRYRPRGWAAANWSPAIAAEHQATREAAGLFDMSSFSKLEIGGTGAAVFLQFLAANQMDKHPGSITYTQLLNERGGIECDLTVTRLSPDRFMLITGAAFGTHDLGWIRQHLPDDGSVFAHDITSSRSTIGLWGPRARDILRAVTEHDVSDAAFPYLTAQHIAVGAIPVLALRVTYVGELGWELYTPPEYAHGLWQALWDTGREYGIVAAGYRAIDSLRLEKGYRYWSADIHEEYNPFEAGLGFAVRLNKGDFLGRGALVKARQRGLERRLCALTLEDSSAVVLGNEPLLAGDRVVGRVTSGGYGYTVRRSIAYAYLPIEYSSPGTALELQWFGEPISVTVQAEPLYDPTNSRIKS